MPSAAMIALAAGAAGVPIAALAQETIPAQQEPAPVEAGNAAAREAPTRFMITAIDVSGVTKLSSAEIERLVYPHLGPDRTTDDVTAAQKALQQAYAAKGYEAVEVEIPVQPNELFSQGIVQLTVHEAPLGRVQVVDAKHHSSEIARTQVPSLVEGQPIDVAALQRDIAAANRFPDRTISPRFKAGATPGTVDVDLEVEDSAPIHASIELNNDSSPNTRSLRLSGTLRHTNLWGQGHTLSITSSLTPQDIDQSAVLSASYSAPLIGTPWSFLFYGYKSNSNVAALGGTNVLGNGYQIGARVSYRLPGDKLFQQISFGPDVKVFEENISLNGAALQPTQIRYLPLVGEYSMGGNDETTSFGLTFAATAGLRVVKHDTCFESPFDTPQPPPGIITCEFGNGDTGVVADQFTGRAIDASENFVRFNLDLNYTRTLIEDFQLALRLSGQLADSSLVTNEQFSIGGMSSVRGYYVSEAVGDDGFVSSIEMRTPSLAPSLPGFVDELRLFSFLDAGYARIRAPAVGQTDEFRIAGIGGGFRLQVFKLLTGEFVIGVPLRAGPATGRGEPRYSFSLKGEF
ncbi:ShlB/FhaC/HecB family hemolysin secretion/activation protein [Sphingomonas psychrotolerans]|uniref:ShlB/FhaC/HecB family hemolysin secretion/activation protein n=1 Tax=Sphingomonas psychrotolerans TaxID=1327635 RepID=A0A2K8MPU5_9SPHN|nr:ShlB/FhaC/HecB family hemolysin secretion/activation protein [Sphingomonas psychrotolerans]ATY34806.1 ShlB/FhaC/HecB family hemolysin secretion/activation protein [Sphingomonas psychrotolerans]